MACPGVNPGQGRRTPAEAPCRPRATWRALACGAGLALAFVGAGTGAWALPCVTTAAYVEPVTRYGHGVLGGAGEFGALELRTTHPPVWELPRDIPFTGKVRRETVTVRLPEDRVFEDLAPRIYDLDGDTCREAVVVESHVERGAQLAVYNGSGEKIAATPYIGRAFRWLAPVGIGDLDGDGAVELAYVDRPHLAKVLRIWRYSDGALTEVARAEGFTNHQIGWDRIAGGLRDCGDGPEMIVASDDWRDVVALRFDGSLTARRLAEYSEKAMEHALACR